MRSAGAFSEDTDAHMAVDRVSQVDVGEAGDPCTSPSRTGGAVVPPEEGATAAARLQSAFRARSRPQGAAEASTHRRRRDGEAAALELALADGRTAHVPAVLAEKLRPYQREGVQFLAKGVAGQLLPGVPGVRGCMLLDEPGLGKTLQVIALVLALVQAGALARVLVVCPASAVGVWKEQVRRFVPREAEMHWLFLGDGHREDSERAIRRLLTTTLPEHLVVVLGFEQLLREQDQFRALPGEKPVLPRQTSSAPCPR